MNSALVSVVMAVKNGERFIKTALESLVAQDYQPLEIIVVNDGSTDKTLEIVNLFKNVRVVEPTKTGVGNAYNAGIRAARGEYVAFLSHDDFWTKDKLRRQIEILQNDSAAMFAVCRAEFFLEDENFVPAGFRRELLAGNHIAYIPETLLARREVFDTVGLFDETMKTSEDVDWFARAFDLKIPSVVVPQVLLHKRIHDRNLHLESVENNRDLLRAVKRSIQRKHESENQINV